ncbi:nucleoside deaminase, partial [Arthrospira platensis SPKY2]
SGNGGPFAALVVLDGKVVGKGVNVVTRINDPTAYAEVMAIRDACRNLGDFRLDSAVIYSSCEPCPMCLSAIYWARISRIYYAAVNTDASKAGFDDSYIY